jgi:carboxylesterase type B
MHPILSATAFLLATSSALAHPTTHSEDPKVHIKNGTVVGKHVESNEQDQFLGIPFAQPPIGDLRFNLPQPVNQTWDAPLNATEYGPMCVNYLLPIALDPKDITYAQSEDCLTVNVVRPAGTTVDSNLPVLVFIYGGGYQEGGSSDGRYNTSYMVQNSVEMGQPTIMVSFNYRLQGFGFLPGDEVKGQGLLNLALRDQRLALSWVQENIGAFGGNSRQVTIQGESVGAISIGYHLLAYGGRDDGLFQAAICESGGPWYFGSYHSSETNEATYQSVLAATNCTDAHDTLSCLRAAPFDVLNATFSALLDEFPFLPTVDGMLVPEYNSVALANNKFVKVPLLVGANTDEGKIFSGTGVNTTEEFRAYIERYSYTHTSNNETVDLLMEAYPYPGSNSTHGQSDDTITPPSPYGAQFMRVARYTGDLMFIAGRRYTCEVWAKNGVPCYSYRFNTIPGTVDPVTHGATHFQEIYFVFDDVIGTGLDESVYNVTPLAREKKYKELGQLMSRMWMSFAGTHSPNHHKSESLR